MFDGTVAEAARIGPNAVTQLIGPLDRAIGEARRDRLLARAGYRQVPGLDAMLDEGPVIGLFREVAALADADALFIEAGIATGRYILANRIPPAVAAVLRLLPGPLAARVLARAIARHAWTFAGSGRFRVVTGPALVLEIADNPLAVRNACQWHEAVFETLFQSLASRRYSALETRCCGRGDRACRFELLGG